MRPIHLVAIFILLALALPAAPAQAGGAVGVCDESHLKSALSGGGTVTFTCSGTITLTSTITIASDTTIDGSGQAVTISGDNQVRVFAVNAGIALKLNRLTIANGKGTGLVYGSGGGVKSSGGVLTINSSTFSGNSALYEGGAIYNDGGSVTIADSSFSGNSAPSYGGAISNDGGTVIVTNGTFSGNGTDNGGAGIYSSSGQVTVSNSNFSNNSADSFSGAIFSKGTLTVSNSTFTNNSAGSMAGAIGSYDMATVSNSSFSGNTASRGGGFVNEGTATVSNSTFSGNKANAGGLGRGGAIQNYGTLTVTNSTLAGNSADLGGGIGSEEATATVVNSTLSDNSATQHGGAIYAYGVGQTVLQNTIVANSTAGGSCYGIITNGGGNLSYPADATCPGINGNPLLGPLQNNGGPTLTMALGAGSGAIDAGNSTGCKLAQINNRDQRGYARFVDGNKDGVAACDVGAFEYGASGPPTATLDPDPPQVSIGLTPVQPDGANGWYRRPVAVTPQATDASPVIDLRCALDPAVPPVAFEDLPAEVCPYLGGAQVSAEGRHAFYAAAMDIWGNKSAPVSREFKIDTPPLGLTSLEMTVNREQAYAGAILEYKLMVRNLTGVAQEFVVTDPIPENTEIVRSINYDPAANAVQWQGVVEPWGFKTFHVYMRIKGSTPGGTAIVNTATLEDEPGGGSASATTIVKTLPPYRGHREDVEVNEMVIRGN